MQLNLKNGFKLPSKLKSDRSSVLKIIKKAQQDRENGNYPSTMKDVSLPIKFDPINSKKICEKGKLCHGWSLTGWYGVGTDASGDSSLIIDVEIKAPRRFKKKSMFGTGWGLSYGPNNSHTETYVSMWQYNQDIGAHDWAPISLTGKMTLAEVVADPTAAQALGTPDNQFWKPVRNRRKKNKIFCAAKRPLKHTLD